MLVIIVNLAKKIIYRDYFETIRSSLVYFLANAAIDTNESLVMDGYTAESRIFSSGHKLIIVHKTQEKISKKFIDFVDKFFIEEMLNPMVDDNVHLSSSFSKKIEEAFYLTGQKTKFSL